MASVSNKRKSPQDPEHSQWNFYFVCVSNFIYCLRVHEIIENSIEWKKKTFSFAANFVDNKADKYLEFMKILRNETSKNRILLMSV